MNNFLNKSIGNMQKFTNPNRDIETPVSIRLNDQPFDSPYDRSSNSYNWAINVNIVVDFNLYRASVAVVWWPQPKPLSPPTSHSILVGRGLTYDFGGVTWGKWQIFFLCLCWWFLFFSCLPLIDDKCECDLLVSTYLTYTHCSSSCCLFTYIPTYIHFHCNRNH